ncbi:DUF3221 domain-containing protein [Bacillus albus]|uniref:DUF3221 domain-containing protein n=1 Tax=Bacillus albus TaxID=2026189 RepID=UPI0032C3DC0D
MPGNFPTPFTFTLPFKSKASEWGVVQSIHKQEQDPFTGYVISVENNYLVVASTSTKDEALAYQNDWWELVNQNKFLRVPISDGENYTIGEQLNVYAAAWTKSLPPIAVMPKIEKVLQ